MRALDPPWYQMDGQAFQACFFVGLDQDPDTACNVDVEVVLRDGSRWAATLVTVAEVDRLMAKWYGTGQASGGSYFWCPDTLVVRDPGITSMTGVIASLVHTPDFPDIFRHLPG